LSRKQHIKKWLSIALWSIAVCIGLFLVLAASRSDNNKNCSAINVEITGAGKEHFISEDGIRGIVKNAGVTENMPLAQIDIRLLEEKITRNAWVKNAELYIDKKSALNIHITENVPVLRIFDIKENNYFLDAVGNLMPPITGYAAKLPVFTGWNPADSAFTGQVLAMAAYLNKNPFWMAQVQQVDISKERMFTIIPSLGSQWVYFGDTALLEDKFSRLYRYYTKVAPKAGFNKFESLNVQYAGQLVAVHKNSLGVAVDSISAKKLIRNLIEQGGQSLADSGRATNSPAQADTLLKLNGAQNAPVVQQPKPAVLPKPLTPAPRNAGNRVVVPPKPKPPRPKPRAVMRGRN
jgi:cell division protein FtsQ